jgi:hypothetical protein
MAIFVRHGYESLEVNAVGEEPSPKSLI